MMMRRRFQYLVAGSLALLLYGSYDVAAFQVTPSSKNLSSRNQPLLIERRQPQRLAGQRQRVKRRLQTLGLPATSSVNGGNIDPPFLDRLQKFAGKNFFLLGMVAAVSLARAFPELGRTGGVLRPELFIGNWGVTCIFLLSGLSLELSELKEAASNHKLNSLVQVITFGAWPLVGLSLTHALRTFAPGLLPPALLEGLLILTCLPTTVNMCILLTSACGGNVASALCNAVISNLAGVFLTPALLLQFFGTSIQLPFTDMVVKLSQKVLLPVGIGQALRATPVKSFYKAHSKMFKRLQEVYLIDIAFPDNERFHCTHVSSFQLYR